MILINDVADIILKFADRKWHPH